MRVEVVHRDKSNHEEVVLSMGASEYFLQTILAAVLAAIVTLAVVAFLFGGWTSAGAAVVFDRLVATVVGFGLALGVVIAVKLVQSRALDCEIHDESEEIAALAARIDRKGFDDA